MKSLLPVSSGSISQLSDDSLQFAYKHAILNNLDEHFICLLEKVITSRGIYVPSKQQKKLNIPS
ncbi:sporulation histidine kinase inhibitor Sda [Sutcliffiella rhizosphaerae]|uniref:Sporulation histidine kinase inhibitor Sda n=1 Tax=Sutcliffiella rhizosphaerae TaxID=2880967 RepID=A0ABM8YL06_9BACI|nr:sporulation histidine kinase inhibitor Sda [Sutcliffiella rhizosphaerae]CAG9620475.1 hypothetical protein BACCIP111883_01243 [Sutcliffiella rhizosphaerae]